MITEYQNPSTSQTKNHNIFEKPPKEVIAFLDNAIGQVTSAQNAHLNSELLLNQHFVELDASQSTYASKSGCTRKTINTSNKRLHELGLHYSTWRGVKKTCLVRINDWFNNLEIRSRYQHILPALKGFPTAALLSCCLTIIADGDPNKLFRAKNYSQRRDYIYKNKRERLSDYLRKDKRTTITERETNRLYSSSLVQHARTGNRAHVPGYFPSSRLNFYKNSQKREQYSQVYGHRSNVIIERGEDMKRDYQGGFRSIGAILASSMPKKEQQHIARYKGQAPGSEFDTPELAHIRRDYEEGKKMLGYITAFNETLPPDRMAKYERIKKRVTELENILKTGVMPSAAPAIAEPKIQEKFQREWKPPQLPNAIDLLAVLPETNALYKPLLKTYTKLTKMHYQKLWTDRDIRLYNLLDTEVQRIMNNLSYIRLV